MSLENNHPDHPSNLVFEPTKKIPEKIEDNRYGYWEKLKNWIKNGDGELKESSKKFKKQSSYVLKKKEKHQETKNESTKNDRKLRRLSQKILMGIGLSGMLLYNNIVPEKIEGKSIDEISSNNVHVAVYQRQEYYKSHLKNVAFRDDSIDPVEVVVKVRLNTSEANQHRREPSIKENIDYNNIISNSKDLKTDFELIKNLSNKNGEKPQFLKDVVISSYCTGYQVRLDGTAPRAFITAASSQKYLGQYVLIEYIDATNKKRVYFGIFECKDTGGAIGDSKKNSKKRDFDIYTGDENYDDAYGIGVRPNPNKKDEKIEIVNAVILPSEIPGITDKESIKKSFGKKQSKIPEISQGIANTI